MPHLDKAAVAPYRKSCIFQVFSFLKLFNSPSHSPSTQLINAPHDATTWYCKDPGPPFSNHNTKYGYNNILKEICLRAYEEKEHIRKALFAATNPLILPHVQLRCSSMQS